MTVRGANLSVSLTTDLCINSNTLFTMHNSYTQGNGFPILMCCYMDNICSYMHSICSYICIKCAVIWLIYAVICIIHRTRYVYIYIYI